MAEQLIIRADAGPRIGAGHVMRCLALAQAWQDEGGSVLFVTALQSDVLLERLEREGIEVAEMTATPGTEEDATITSDLACRSGADWVVVDGYHFGADYQKRIKEFGVRLLFLDDYGHAEHYCSDVVLNQNIGDWESRYSDREPHTRLLLGSRYLLLRREFQRWRNWNREISSQGCKVLVSMGGGDTSRITAKVIKALSVVPIDDLEVSVMVAGGSRTDGLDVLHRELGVNIELVRDATNVADRMSRSDVAVTGGGGTCWEAAFMGLPSLAAILAENQPVVVDALSERRALIPLGQVDSLTEQTIAKAIYDLLRDSELRRRLSISGRDLVDGQGAGRVVAHLRGQALWLRRVTEEDRELIFKWANDPSTRGASFCSDSIPWDRHVTWLGNRLGDPDCYYYIVHDSQNAPIGQVRFDVEQNKAQISVGVDSRFRGRGYAAQAIELGSNAVFQASNVSRINALIKPGNEASCNSFRRAGYLNAGETLVRGLPALRYVLERDMERSRMSERRRHDRAFLQSGGMFS